MPTHRRASLVPWVQRLRSAVRCDGEGVLQLVREAEQGGCSDLHLLAEVYGQAAELYPGDRRAQDPQFAWLCIKCLRALCQTNPADAREFYHKLRAEGVGQLDARLYEARAAMEQRLGDGAKASRLLQEGLKARAEPAELLSRALRELAADGEAALQVSPPVAPLPATAAAASAAAAAIVERRLQRARESLARLAEAARACEALTVTLAAWRVLLQQEQQSRREALFDSMAAQVQAARADTEGAAWRRDAMLRVLRRRHAGAGLRGVVVAWAFATRLVVERAAAAGRLARYAERSRGTALAELVMPQALLLWRQLAVASRMAAAAPPQPPAAAPQQWQPAAATLCCRSPQARRFSLAGPAGVMPAGMMMVDCLLEDLSSRSLQRRHTDSASSRHSQQAAAAGRISGVTSLSPTRYRQPPDVQVHTHLSRQPSRGPPARLSASVPVLAAAGWPGGASYKCWGSPSISALSPALSPAQSRSDSSERSESPLASAPSPRLRLRRLSGGAADGAQALAASLPAQMLQPSFQAGSPYSAGGRSPLADVAAAQPLDAAAAAVGAPREELLKPGMAIGPASLSRRASLRGPERFYYDKSSYTGCARYGGDRKSVV